LHFIQKLSGPRNSTISSTDPDSGIIYTTDYFGGVRHWRYTTTCASTPVPFFTMPTTDYYGIVRVQNKGNNRWDIEVIRSVLLQQFLSYIFLQIHEHQHLPKLMV
jgi:hypothetical protein